MQRGVGLAACAGRGCEGGGVVSTFAGGNNYVSTRSYSDRCPTRTCELYAFFSHLLGSTRIRPFATLEGVVPSRSE